MHNLIFIVLLSLFFNSCSAFKLKKYNLNQLQQDYCIYTTMHNNGGRLMKKEINKKLKTEGDLNNCKYFVYIIPYDDKMLLRDGAIFNSQTFMNRDYQADIYIFEIDKTTINDLQKNIQESFLFKHAETGNKYSPVSSGKIDGTVRNNRESNLYISEIEKYISKIRATNKLLYKNKIQVFNTYQLNPLNYTSQYYSKMNSEENAFIKIGEKVFDEIILFDTQKDKKLW